MDRSEYPSKQGSASSGWLILDYGSIIVHIMTPQLRNFYKLEKRWKDAEIYEYSSHFTKLYEVGQDGNNERTSSWLGENESNEVKRHRDFDNDDRKYRESDENDVFWS